MKFKNIIQTFKKKRVMTIKQLADILSRSEITARRKLKSWGALTSINENGKYYTLPDVPQFDENGLWSFRKIYFSAHGNLKQTIIRLTGLSAAGIPAMELLESVGLSGNSSVLSQMVHLPGIRRQRFHRSFVYFSDDTVVYERQLEQRERIHAAVQNMPSDAEAVIILTQLVRHPGISLTRLTRKARQQGAVVSVQSLRLFLEKHNLSEYTRDETAITVKKTSDTES